MASKLPPPSSLEVEETIAVTSILVSKSLFPHPEVVAQFEGPVLPSIRGNRQLGLRGTVIDRAGASILLDDNTTPRWSLLLAHGFGPNYPAGSRGWSLAHIWPVPQCPHSYTHLANLALVPLRLSSLTDAEGPAAAYLRFHSWQAYGWHPPGVGSPDEPPRYAELSWRYLPMVDDAPLRVRKYLTSSGNDWAKKMVGITLDLPAEPQSSSSS
jgi:hypothetical protein